MGMIYKEGETYWIKYYRNGKPYCESSKSHKETDAEKLLRRRESVNEENWKDASEKLAMQFEQHKEIIAQAQKMGLIQA